MRRSWRTREKIAAEINMRDQIEAGEYLYELKGYGALYDGLPITKLEGSVR